MLINVDWHRSGMLVYKSATIVGFGGTITAVRPGAFSVSINERDEGTLFDNIMTMLAGHMGNTFAMRYALENFDKYADAIEFFKTEKLVSPCYYIVGGVSGNDGSVITRARDEMVDFWTLSDDQWWLVQTNYDHWTDPGPNEIRRRVTAENFIKNAGQSEMNVLSLLDLLHQYPVDHSITVHHSIMDISTGFLWTMPSNSTHPWNY